MPSTRMGHPGQSFVFQRHGPGNCDLVRAANGLSVIKITTGNVGIGIFKVPDQRILAPALDQRITKQDATGIAFVHEGVEIRVGLVKRAMKRFTMVLFSAMRLRLSGSVTLDSFFTNCFRNRLQVMDYSKFLQKP